MKSRKRRHERLFTARCLTSSTSLRRHGRRARESCWPVESAAHPILQGPRSGDTALCRSQDWRKSALHGLHPGESHTWQETSTSENALCRTRTLEKVVCCRKLTSKELWNQEGKKIPSSSRAPPTPPTDKV